jgi:uncharacterized protein with FMN-binding domain
LDGDIVKRIVLWLASTVTIVVLLFGYHTSTNKTADAGATSSASSPAARSSSTTPSTGTSSPSPSSSKSSSTASTTKTYTGSVAQTRWGPVQVQITIKGGTITKVDVVQQPNGNPRDVEINDQALPILIQDTLDAQSAKIDMVSGATVTSTGYLQSLQSALDEAGR